MQLFEKSNRFKCSPFSDALHFDLYLLILPWGSFLFLSVQKDPKKRLSAHDLLVRPIKPCLFECLLYKLAGFFHSDVCFLTISFSFCVTSGASFHQYV